MKISKFLLYAVMPMMCITVAKAQEKGPQKNDFTVAATVSYNNNVMQKAKPGNWTNYSVTAASTNFSDQKLSVGIEGGWFFSDLWKLNLGGGMNISKHPGYSGVPGTYDPASGDEIGDATAVKMKEYRSVVWAQHGIFCTGESLDETFGLIETIEKAAEIYLKICDKKIVQSISNDNLKEIAKAFKIDYKKGIID